MPNEKEKKKNRKEKKRKNRMNWIVFWITNKWEQDSFVLNWLNSLLFLWESITFYHFHWISTFFCILLDSSMNLIHFHQQTTFWCCFLSFLPFPMNMRLLSCIRFLVSEQHLLKCGECCKNQSFSSTNAPCWE